MNSYRHMLVAILLSAAAVAPTFAAIPADIQKSNILHCFDWKFSDIKAELPRIHAAGFGAVQVSPVQGNCASGAEWYYAYLPWDFKMRNDKANGNGTRNELADLCREAETYGIKIIVDVVSNHVNPAKSYRDPWWNENGRERDNGAVDYNNRYSITHGNIGNYKDVNSELSEVQERIKEMLLDLKSLGVDGIRWDAAKHIALPSEGCNFWTAVKSVGGLWHYGEILDNPGTNADTEWNVMREYADFMSVTDSGFATMAINMLKQGRMPVYLSNLSRPKDQYGVDFPADKLVYWGESHDTYANDGGSTKNVEQSVIDRIYMLGANRQNETAIYFSRPSQKNSNQIRMGQKGSTHALEDAAIAATNNFRINTADIPEKAEVKYGADGYMVNVRQNAATYILLPKAGEREVTITNPDGWMPSGNYTELLSGNTFTVTSDAITGKVGSQGVAVIYVDGFNSVESIDAPQPTEIIYYDLTGRRVENPQKGLFIKVENGKASKILL